MANSKNPVVREILKQGSRLPAAVRRRLEAAALETGRVESNFQNLPGGDADSAGWRQERASLYANPTNVPASVARFYQEAQKLYHGQPSFQLAADVQRPAAQYRGRYKGAQGEALGLLGGGVASPSHASSPSYQTSSTTTSGVDNSQARKLAVLGFLQSGGVRNPQATTQLAATYQSLADVPARTTTSTTLVHPSTSSRPTGNPQVDSTVDQLKQQMQTINDAKVPYLWGGGHQAHQVSPHAKVTPLDCSGAVSRALGIDPRVAAQFKAWGQAGQGKRVTVWAAKDGSHVLMEVDGHLWGTSRTNPGGGAGWIPKAAISPAYLSRFTPRHPPGA